MYKNNINTRKNNAVSEIISLLLLITITIVVFVGLHQIIVSDSGPEAQQTVILSGKLVGDTYIVEHCRGPSLDLNTKCIVEIGGFSYNYYVKNLLNSKSKEDDLWSIGERLVCKLENITYLKVSFSIVDTENNLVLFDQTIQDGLISEYPYIVLTLNPTEIEGGSTKLWLGYNFRNYSGSVRFSYKKLGESWVNTPWESKTGEGLYNKTISSLLDEIYIYRAELSCESNILNGEEIPILQDEITSVDKISPYQILSSPITINVTGNSQLDGVKLYYRWSDDNTSWGSESESTTWSAELLTNPSFETGDTTGWLNAGGGTMTVGTDCPWGTESPYEGTYYSYWLAAGEKVNAYAYQNVSLASYASYIDLGKAKINVTGWLVSDEYHIPVYDEFFMHVNFYDASNALMSGYSYQSGGTNPVSQGTGNNVNNWAQYGITNYTIPTGARKVQVKYYAWEYIDGSSWWDAGSADNFSIKVGVINSIGNDNWNIFGTDYNSPWTWNFNFPFNEGYYQFYSIGIYSNTSEIKPSNPDTICQKQ